MTYAENVKTFTNIELVEDLICNIEQNIESDSLKKSVIADEHIEICKAELLSRLNRDPMSENCGNCRYLTFGTSEQGKNVWNCRNKEPLISNFWNFRTSSYDVYVNKTIRCSLWEGGDK